MVYPVAFCAVVIAVWAIAAKAGDNEFVLPSPLSALGKTGELLTQKALYVAFGNTLLRTLEAWAISLVLATALATAGKFFPPLGRFLSPLVSVVRALPTMSVVLLLVIWTSAKTAPIVVAILVVMPTTYAAIKSAIDSVDPLLLETCRVYGVPKSRVFARVYFPCVIRAVALPVSSSLSLTLKLMVAAEVLASTARSLGGMMQMSKLYYETASLMALTVMTIVVAIVLETALYRVIKLFFKEERA